ncbi:MAG: hypothetical protein Q9198_010352 [Flavoplaca austrocitrina]
MGVVCLVAGAYCLFNAWQQTSQVRIDPGRNNTTESEATANSSGIDPQVDPNGGSQARQHSDPSVLATVNGYRSNLMDVDFGPKFVCNPSIIRHQAPSTSRTELALGSRSRERYRDRTPTPRSRFPPESTVGRSTTPGNSPERGYTTPRSRLDPRSFALANPSPAISAIGSPSYVPSSIADPMPAETVGRTIIDEIDKWVEDSWITRGQKSLVNRNPHREQKRSKLLHKVDKFYETRYRNEVGVKIDSSFDVYGTPVSYHYDLIKCSFMFRLWTRQTRINGLPEQYNPDLARNPAPGQFLLEDDDAKSVDTSVTSMN